jgi:hypothetical protein
MSSSVLCFRFLARRENIRNRLLRYIPVIRCGQILNEVHRDQMVCMLDLGPVFTDRSSTGRMRDSCPIALLRLEHGASLFCNGCSAEAICLLPWALVMTSLQSDAIGRYSRFWFFLLMVASVIAHTCPNRGKSDPRSSSSNVKP